MNLPSNRGNVPKIMNVILSYIPLVLPRITNKASTTMKLPSNDITNEDLQPGASKATLSSSGYHKSVLRCIKLTCLDEKEEEEEERLLGHDQPLSLSFSLLGMAHKGDPKKNNWMICTNEKQAKAMRKSYGIADVKNLTIPKNNTFARDTYPRSLVDGSPHMLINLKSPPLDRLFNEGQMINQIYGIALKRDQCTCIDHPDGCDRTK